MAKTCSYDVNRASPPKDSSFRAFLCALLVFFALCLIIFLVLMLTRPYKEGDAPEHKKETEELEYANNKEKFIIEKIDDVDTEESTTLKERPTSTTKRSKYVAVTATTTTSTSRPRDNGYDTTLGNDIDDVQRKDRHTTEKRPVHTTEHITEQTLVTRKHDNVKQLNVKSTNSSESTTTGSTYETTRPIAINKVQTGGHQTTQEFFDSTTEDTGTTVNMIFETRGKYITINPSLTTESLPSTTEENETIDSGIDHELFHEDYLSNNTTAQTTEDINSTTEVPYSTSDLATNRRKSNLLNSFAEDSTTDTNTEATDIYSTEYSIAKGQNGTLSSASENETDDTESTSEDTFTDEDNFTTEKMFTKRGRLLRTTSKGSEKKRANILLMTTESYDTTDTSTIFDEGSSSSTTEEDDEKNGSSTETSDSTTVSTSEITTSTLGSIRYVNVTTEDTSNGSSTTTSTHHHHLHETSLTTASSKTTTESTTQTSYVLTQNPISAQPPSSVCRTSECSRASSKLLFLMNYTADPCEDFYDYACGGQKIDETFTRKQNLKRLIAYMDEIVPNSEKYLLDFKNFYQSCVDYEQNFTISDRLKFLFDGPNVDIDEVFAELILTQSMPLFNIGLDIDTRDQNYVFKLTLPGASSLKTHIDGWSVLDQVQRDCIDMRKMFKKKNLGNEYIFVWDCQMEKFKNIAQSFVKEMEMHFQIRYNAIYSKENLENLLELMKGVAESLPPEIETKKDQVTRNHGYSEVQELGRATNLSMVDWVEIFNKLTFNGSVSPDDVVNLYHREYFIQLSQILSKFNETEIINALWLYSRLQLYVNTVLPMKPRDRASYCMDLAKQLMPATASVITYRLFKSEHHVDIMVKALFNRLKQKLDDSLSATTIDDTSKAAMREKLNKIDLKPIAIGDSRRAVANHANVNVGENDYQANVVELLEHHNKIVYSLQNDEATPASLLRYFVDPLSVRPKSFYTTNSIVYTTLLDSTPLALPPYVRAATLGMHLSRELTKHFDIVGKAFLGPDVNRQGYEDLESRTKTLLEIYANNTYTVDGSDVSFRTNEFLWINQMIADNAAFRLVFDYFSEQQQQKNLPWIFSDFPQEKIFFIAAAQEYCRTYTPMDFMEDAYVSGNLPPALRVQNVVSNAKEFAEIFECHPGSTMTLPDEDMITQFPNLDYSSYNSYDGLGNN